ncbi:mitochondrial carrier domain-containing protein [Catenaria anguillulae PL171]|uniref:Mitochondrial carrier domain-containing protein n=1 Tax=Catenaria anguillulae PL171 TaxID=765915 RepID=A0A1Y2HAS7_9FUNG|nr:mitochondrial carrier domain-containing protein [Catenaria anguillulae PL171]
MTNVHSASIPISSQPFTMISSNRAIPTPATKKPEPTTGHAFVAGAVGLSLAYATMHPLDSLKTIIQAASDPSSSAAAKFKDRPAGFKPIWNMLSRGFTASVLGAAAQGGLRLSSYETTKKYLAPYGGAAHPVAMTTFAALVGDLASSIVKVPREVVTARMQTGFYSGPGAPKTAIEVVGRIVRDEGPLALWQGFGPIIARDGPFMIVLFVTYESFKARYNNNVQATAAALATSVRVRDGRVPAPSHAHAGSSMVEVPVISTSQSTLFGGISGALAGFTTTPLDVLRTRVLTTATAVQQARPKGIVSGLTDIYRQDGGVKALYRGAVARSAWWFCVCSIFFPTYEAVKEACAARSMV